MKRASRNGRPVSHYQHSRPRESEIRPGSEQGTQTFFAPGTFTTAAHGDAQFSGVRDRIVLRTTSSPAIRV